MKFKILPLLVLFCLSGFALVHTQNAYGQASTIIDELQADGSGAKGTIRVSADPGINQLLGFPMAYTNFGSDDSHVMKTTGYRVQAFSGNDPRRSKDEAISKERRIKEAFPEVATYVTYKSPKWSLRVGDFRTKEEAAVFMQTLKSTFPDLGREMYPVRDEVNIIIDNRK